MGDHGCILAGVTLVATTLVVLKLLPRMWFNKYHGPYTENETRAFLYTEDIFSLCYYLGVLAYLFRYFMDTDFLWTLDISHNGGDNYTELAQQSESFIIFNVFFYLGLIATLFIRPVRRGNWTEQFVHHAATLVLIYVAYATRWRMASVWVLALNFLCDIFVQLSYISHRAKSNLDIPAFAALIAVHAYTRVYVYPIRIYTTTVSNTALFSTPLEHAAYLTTIPLYLLWVMWLGKMLIICHKRLVLGEKNNDYAESKVE